MSLSFLPLNDLGAYDVTVSHSSWVGAWQVVIMDEFL